MLRHGFIGRTSIFLVENMVTWFENSKYVIPRINFKCRGGVAKIISASDSNDIKEMAK